MRCLILLLAISPTLLTPAERLTCNRNEYPVQVKVDPKQAKCLATMIYGEARGESLKGKVAVAYTAKNRAVKKTLCQVVLAPKQYSIFNNNPRLIAAALNPDVAPVQKNTIDQQSWIDSLEAAQIVLQGKSKDPTNGASHYVADKVMKSKGYIYPRWTKVFPQVAVIDNHRFFKEPMRRNDKS